MSDWRSEFERERHTRPSPPPADATAQGPSRTYAQWVQDRSCGDKRAYTTQVDARRTVLLHWRDGDDAHEYRCPYGEHWHVSTRPEEMSA